MSCSLLATNQCDLIYRSTAIFPTHCSHVKMNLYSFRNGSECASPCYKSVARTPIGSQILGRCLTRQRRSLGRREAVKDQFGYGTPPNSDVYHLVDLKTSTTLCGLPTNFHSLSGIAMFVHTTRPEHGKLCRHCDDAVDS